MIRSLIRPVVSSIGKVVSPALTGGDGISWSSFWVSIKSLWYKSRTGLVLNDEFGNDGSIIPAVSQVKTTDYVYHALNNFASGDSTGYIEIRFYNDGNAGVNNLFTSASETATARYFRVYNQNSLVYLKLQQNVTTVFTNTIRLTAAVSVGWHIVRWVSVGGVYNCIIDGVTKTIANGGLTLSAGSDDGRWMNLITLRNNICIGAYKTSAAIVAPVSTFAIDYVDWNNAYKWIMHGQGNRIFDIIGGVHLTWTGTSHLYFDSSASTLLLDSGYSVYTKTGEPNEYVPYKTGSPYDVSVYLGATYIHQSDHAGSATGYNFAPSLVDFDPTDAAPAVLAVLDRSNITYQTAASRASAYYDVANVYRYHSSELADPRVYNLLWNVGYKGRYFSKITVDAGEDNPLIITEFILTDVDLKTSKEWKAMLYCGSSVFAEYPNGNYTTDADGYVEFHDIAYSDDFGTSAALTAYENSAILNPLIASGDYRKIVIGSVATDVYLISQPLLPNNCDIDVNCILRMMNSVTDVLAADIIKTATSFTATDASKFHLGEYIVVTDDGQIFSYDVQRGWGGKIIDITGNVITLDTAAPYDYDASNNGRMCTKSSNILIQGGSHVTIDVVGGYIDGNAANQGKIHPMEWYGGNEVEVLRMGMGIASWESSYITLTDNVVVRNGSIHGVCFASNGVLNQYLTIGDIHIYDCEQKGINFKFTQNGTLGDVVVDGSVWEDGIMFYTTNSHWTAGDLVVTNCGRAGFNWNANNHSIVINSVTTSGCAANGFDCGSKDLTVTVGIFTSDAVRFNQANPAGGGVSNVNITLIDIDGTILAPATNPVVWFYGGVKTVTIGTLTLDGCTGVGVKASVLSGLFPDDIRVNSGGIYTHTGTKQDIAVGSDVILVGDFT